MRELEGAASSEGPGFVATRAQSRSFAETSIRRVREEFGPLSELTTYEVRIRYDRDARKCFADITIWLVPERPAASVAARGLDDQSDALMDWLLERIPSEGGRGPSLRPLASCSIAPRALAGQSGVAYRVSHWFGEDRENAFEEGAAVSPIDGARSCGRRSARA